MALYCFAENRRGVFTEAAVRGAFAGIRDYPRLKSREESAAQALQEAEELQADVCCITSLAAYQHMFITAYCSAYDSKNTQLTEREIVPIILVVKQLSPDEAIAAARSGFSDKETQDLIEDAFTQYENTFRGLF
jgi:hypothetical protein